MNLRNKFIASFFVVGIIPLILMGIVSIYLIDLANKYNVASQEANLLIQKNDEIKSFMAEITETMRIKIGGEDEAEVKAINLADQEFLLQGILDVLPEIEEVSFLSIAGLEGEDGRRFEIGRETRKKSKRQTIYQSIDSEDLFNQSASEKFQVAKEGKDYFSEVYWTLSGPIMTTALPVYNKSEKIISVISAEINLNNIQKKIIGKSRLGSSGYVFLVDLSGRIIAHSTKPEFIYKDISNTPIVKSALNGFLISPLDEEGSYTNYLGEKVVASTGSVSNLGWGIIVEWPESDAFSTVNDISKQVLIFSFFVFVIVILLGIFIAKRILDPLNKLKMGARKIGDGSFGHIIDIKTKDELEELGKEFNEMAKGLKRLKELRDEFVFVAAHELRTPVTAIKGYISMLLEGDAGELPDEASKYLSQTNKANERLVQLVNDLLEIARSEAGRLEIKVSSQNIVENINTIIAELKPLVAEKNIKLKYELKGNMPQVLADEGRLKEVLINLIGNAVKYNKEGGGIEIFNEIKDGSVVTHIKDTGFGMSQEDLEHLFEKFWRSESKDIRKQGGTGLGLFITKELVEKMGGEIWAISQDGVGSTFSFSLPIVK